MRGSLSEFSLAEILELVNLSRRSGLVRLERDSQQASVSFRAGKVIAATDGSPTDPIGALLVRQGVITPKQLQEALDLQIQTRHKLLCEVLLEIGLVTREEIARRLQERTEEAVYRLFEWAEGDFLIDTYEGQDESEDPFVSLSPTHLIMEGARRIDEWQRIREKLPSGDIVLQFAPSYALRGDDISLTPPEWEILALVNGERDVDAIVAKSPCSPFEAQRILYGLLSSGLLIYRSQLALSSGRLEAMRRALARLVEESQVRCAVVADSRGQIILTEGSPAGLDIATIAILSVASIATAMEMVNLVGEQGFEILLHQGDQQRVIVAGLSSLGVLVVLFDTTAQLGVVQICVSDFVGEVGRIFERQEATAAG
jgi:predicted regulator of Ras-like GTPase activity (Roadblock/LC7/MglB family)